MGEIWYVFSCHLQYRDTVRQFIKGTDGFSGAFAECLCGSPNLYRVILLSFFHSIDMIILSSSFSLNWNFTMFLFHGSVWFLTINHFWSNTQIVFSIWNVIKFYDGICKIIYAKWFSWAASLTISMIQEGGRKPWNSINFVCAHDGFTLADLVTYNKKHNLANGEDNNDGENHNNSWNCGQVKILIHSLTCILRFLHMCFV